MTPLFRPEVVAAQQADWLGSVQLLQPPALRWLGLLVALAAVALAGFLATATYTRKAILPGLLMPPAGIVRLAAPQPGVVVEQRVVDGQTVRQGEVLFVLRPAHGALLDGAQAEVQRSLDDRRGALQDSARLQQQLTSTRLAALSRRLLALQAELAQLDAEFSAQQQRLALAREALDRQRALQAQQFISQAQVQAKEEEVLAVQALLQSLRRQRAGLERERAELEGERASLPLQGAQQQNEVARSMAQLARERAEQDPQRQFTVLSPQDGVVSALLVQAGQTVVEGSPLAAVMPPSSAGLQVQLLAPAAAVGLLRQGQAVRLRYDAFPFQRFGQQQGTIASVSPLPLSAADLAALPLSPSGIGQLAAEPRYRVLVALDADPGPALPLRPGMGLHADVALETRSWLQWMLAPALGLAGRL
jgi:membrane fusion protein